MVFSSLVLVNDVGNAWLFTCLQGTATTASRYPALTKRLGRPLCGDRGYIAYALPDPLFAQGLERLTQSCKPMKHRLMRLWDTLLLRIRALLAPFNDQLQHISQSDHMRHHSVTGFMAHLIAALTTPWFPPVSFVDAASARHLQLNQRWATCKVAEAIRTALL